jgi:hypothetical protein
LQREGAQIRGRIGERESGGGESPHASGQKAAPGRVLHTLFYRAETRIVKPRHVGSVHELSEVEPDAVWTMVARIREQLMTGLAPDGFVSD